MADTLTGSPFVGERQADPNRNLQRVLIVLVAILAAALVLELVYHLVIAPRLTITNVTVNNSTPIPDAELLAAAGISAGMMYFSIDTAQLESRIEAIPVVREALVELSFPNRLTVTAYQREPLAWSIVPTGSGARTVVFDDEGVVFRTDVSDSDGWMPVISGLRFPAASVGLVLPELLSGFLHSLRALKAEAPELFGLISEYRVVRKNDGAYDVVLYPMHFDVPVRIGRTIDAGMLQYVVMTLEMLKREGRLEGVAEIDFRSGEGVLRPEGGDRG